MSVDCRKCTSMISGFLDDRLNNAQLSDFLDHIEGCEDCKEELTDHYLVYKGLEKLETGGAFDLFGDFKEEMVRAHERLEQRRRLFRVAAGIEILTAAFFIIVVALAAFY